jgi:hypothetical protein
MIGQGLQETFGIDEVAAADYLRGMPGAATAYSRQEMVKIMRQPAPPAAPVEKRVGYTPATRPSSGGSGSVRYMDQDAVKDWVSARNTDSDEASAPTPRRPSRAARTDSDGLRLEPNAKGEYLPGVLKYASVSEQEEGVDAWKRRVKSLDERRAFVQGSHDFWSSRDPQGFAAKDTAAELARLTAAHDEATAKYEKAQAQTPKQFFPPADRYFPVQWQRMAEDAATKARIARSQITREEALDNGGSKRKIATLTLKAEQAEARAVEADKKATAAREAQAAAAPSEQNTEKGAKAKAKTSGKRKGKGRSGKNPTTRSTTTRSAKPASGTPTTHFRGVKTYDSTEDQSFGVRGWRNAIESEKRDVRLAQSALDHAERHSTDEPLIQAARDHLALKKARLAEATQKHAQALAQNPRRTEIAARRPSPNELRASLTSLNDRIHAYDKRIIRAERDITRKNASDLTISSAKYHLAFAEDEVAILTRARDDVLTALDTATANAVKPPVRNRDKSA